MPQRNYCSSNKCLKHTCFILLNVIIRLEMRFANNGSWRRFPVFEGHFIKSFNRSNPSKSLFRVTWERVASPLMTLGYTATRKRHFICYFLSKIIEQSIENFFYAFVYYWRMPGCIFDRTASCSDAWIGTITRCYLPLTYNFWVSC